jgi:hypothetical protein
MVLRSIASLPFSQRVSHRFSLRRSNLLVEGKGSFSVDHCLLSVFQLAERESHIPERGSFAPAVADLACDHKALLMELDGAAAISQRGVGQAQVAECPTFRVTPFQCSPGDCYRLRVLMTYLFSSSTVA